jgi:hypothetical protein
VLAALLMLLTAMVAMPDQAGASSGPATPAAATAVPPGGRFFDDDGSVHEASIEAIAAVGITLGCNPPYSTAYCPNEPVTREQMAAFLVRALGLTDAGGGNTFVDDDGSVFENKIAILAAAGITKGCNPPTNDRFCPHDYVTRGQMAAFLVRAMGYTEGDARDIFDDDDGSVFEPAIGKLAVAGVTKGCNPPANTNFCPDDVVTRDQMATFLARALDLSSPAVPERPYDSDGTYLNVFADAAGHGCDYSDGEVCRMSYDVSGEFFIATGWYADNWSSIPGDAKHVFESDAVRVEAIFDDMPLTLHDWGFEVVDNVADKWWSYVFPDWLTGSHHIEVMLIDDSADYLWTAAVTVNAHGPGYSTPAAVGDTPAGVVRSPAAAASW